MRFFIVTFLNLNLLISFNIVANMVGSCFAETIDQVVNPKKSRNEWVSDMANIIDPSTERELNLLIDQLEKRTTAEIAVVTINRTDGRTPKEFATDLFNRWGLGKKGVDNGILVLLVLETRRIEVETGYGVEGKLPDGKVGEILDKHVIPRFKEGNYSQGLLDGVKAMGEVIMEGEGRGAERGVKMPEQRQVDSSTLPSPLREIDKAVKESEESGNYSSVLSYLLCGLALIIALLLGLQHWTMTAGKKSYRIPIFVSGIFALIFSFLPALSGGVFLWPLAFGGIIAASLGGLIFAEPKTIHRLGKSRLSAYVIKGIYIGAVIVGSVLSIAIGGAMIILIIGMSIPFWILLKRYFQQFPVLCDNCHKPMRFLAETQEDAYLKGKQLIEEQLGSVNYHVWRCDDCQTCKIRPNIRWFSGYSKCPRCGARTFEVSSVRVIEPTYISSGLERVIKKCHYKACNYMDTLEVVIPILTRSSTSGSFGRGSSSGSFGGGRSGGGGAGRSW